MIGNYVLSMAAEVDLRGIVRYSRTEWGDVQARKYIAQLKGCIENITAGSGAFKDMSALHPGLRMVHCGHHLIFCLPRENAPALVIAIFHERMDLMRRLAGRLA